MAHTCIFNSTEHGQSTDLSVNKILKIEKVGLEELRYLAIKRDDQTILKDSKSEEEYISQPRAGYYIGYRWFEENETYLKVTPKTHTNNENAEKSADFMAMFLECLKNPSVSKTIMDNSDKLYKIFFDEPFIEIGAEKDQITPFLIIHFLQLVKNITRKGLKKGYIKVTENLTSKIKGKILINQTIKQNHFKNRLDKTVCNHQIFTINCIENQIIKTALMQCGKHLYNIANSDIAKMLKQNLNAFELVDEKEVFDSDFTTIKYSPFYKEYKEALNLAKMIFKRFGFALNNSSSNSINNKIPPYYINMPELFERYVEVKLRQGGYDVIDGNKNKVAVWDMRPDFLIPANKMIIDAKYKYWFESGKNGKDNENSEYKSDYMQLALYGRDLEVRKNLGIKDNEINSEVDLLFIYPSFDENKKDLKIENVNNEIVDPQDSRKFNKIKRLGLYVPIDIEKGWRVNITI